jgi:predicted RNase H-like HicB family nuclease
MRKIIVEGFEVLVEKGRGCFVLSVPELPGIVGQVRDIRDAREAMRALILAHARSLAKK